MKPIWFKLGKRVVLVAGSPRDLVGVTPRYTHRGELALYLDS